MPRALKVYRTPIGFHDAYVAAPTQKAALEAWGTDRNLFARGDAEIVTDPKLTEEPLSKPGMVFKRARGSDDAQFAALNEGEARPRKTGTSGKRASPRPDRTRLDAVEAELEAAAQKHRIEDRALEREFAALEKKRQAIKRRQAREIARLDKARDTQERAYQRGLDTWRNG